jgi:hypothetical protein
MKTPQPDWQDRAQKGHTTFSAWTQSQRNWFDWGFRKASHGRDSGGRLTSIMIFKGKAAGGDVLARVI